MNKKVITFGLIILLLLILFPPVEYTTAFTGALQTMFGGEENTMTTIRPIFMLESEEMQDVNIKYPIWAISMLLTVVITSAVSYLVDE